MGPCAEMFDGWFDILGGTFQYKHKGHKHNGDFCPNIVLE